MATLYGKGKGLVRVGAGLQVLLGLLMFVFGIVAAVILCHWTSKAGLGIWIGIIIMVTAALGLKSCSVTGEPQITWYSYLSVLCAFLAIVVAVSYGTAMADFYDELTSDKDAVDTFYSRQYVAVYMRTSYYQHCVTTQRKEEIERERTGTIYIDRLEQDEQNKLLSEMEKHGRRGFAIALVFLLFAILEFIFASLAIMYSCTAAGWFLDKPTNTAAKSNVTIHHSRASGLL